LRFRKHCAMIHSSNQQPENDMSKQVTNITNSVFGTFGLLNGREVEFCRATRMWAYTDGTGYAYGAHS
jgi:hypothetical protein